jgi:uridine kinase
LVILDAFIGPKKSKKDIKMDQKSNYELEVTLIPAGIKSFSIENKKNLIRK